MLYWCKNITYNRCLNFNYLYVKFLCACKMNCSLVVVNYTRKFESPLKLAQWKTQKEISCLYSICPTFSTWVHFYYGSPQCILYHFHCTEFIEIILHYNSCVTLLWSSWINQYEVIEFHELNTVVLCLGRIEIFWCAAPILFKTRHNKPSVSV